MTVFGKSGRRVISCPYLWLSCYGVNLYWINDDIFLSLEPEFSHIFDKDIQRLPDIRVPHPQVRHRAFPAELVGNCQDGPVGVSSLSPATALSALPKPSRWRQD